VLSSEKHKNLNSFSKFSGG